MNRTLKEIIDTPIYKDKPLIEILRQSVENERNRALFMPVLLAHTDAIMEKDGKIMGCLDKLETLANAEGAQTPTAPLTRREEMERETA